jgi:hypothetical protein
VISFLILYDGSPFVLIRKHSQRGEICDVTAISGSAGETRFFTVYELVLTYNVTFALFLEDGRCQF